MRLLRIDFRSAPSSLLLALPFAFVLSATTPIRASEDRAELVERLDVLLEANYPSEEPGAAVLAKVQGETILRKGYGLASLELKVPMTPENTFCLASVTKPFTATAIMVLVDEGEISLEDPVRDYLPLVHGDGIQIRHLLSHTSALPDLPTIEGFTMDLVHRPYSSAELAGALENAKPSGPPGRQYQYCNANYALLGRIVELVSGKSWEKFLKEKIFEPAGMTSTFDGGHMRVLPRSATGYSLENGTWKRAAFLSYSRGFGLGGLFSCVDDLALWEDALARGKIVKPETLEKMYTPFGLDGGGQGNYGLGWIISTSRGRKRVEHSGGIFGWKTHVLKMPEERIFVAILTNRDDFPGPHPPALAQRIAKDILRSL